MPEPIITAVAAVIALAAGLVIGFVLRRLVAANAVRRAEHYAERLVGEARAKQKEIILEAKDEALRLQRAGDEEAREKRADLQRGERRLLDREEAFDRKVAALEQREAALEERGRSMDVERAQLAETHQRQLAELERVSGLSVAEARSSLIQLISDGRIHPGRIEETVAKCRSEIEVVMRQAGEQAAYDAGVPGLHPELIKLLGRLKYRTSYGQNVLDHCIETARLAGLLAAEIGANVAESKKGGLLHDIGKAVDHEVEGPHALIGGDIAARYGVNAIVCNAIAAHHQEVEQESTEATVVQIADAISASRPGARGESLDNYVKRLDDLQQIALSFPGVERCFAIQAGREIRILVRPEEMDDLASSRLARDVVKKIEEQLQYPGQIKVTVIRETRAVDYAR